MSNAASKSTSEQKRASGPGRPRAFDEAAALEAAMNVFWQKGFEATSLDDLTSAMGLSRSSFYATFGSKQDLFLRAVGYYSRNGIRGLAETARAAEASDANVVDAMMQALSDPKGGPRGCLLINCITELAPHDEKVAELGRRHLESIEGLFAKALDPANPDAARDKASAYSSLAIGTLALRKAGIPAERITRTIQQAKEVLSP